jgi:hypothetical protein
MAARSSTKAVKADTQDSAQTAADVAQSGTNTTAAPAEAPAAKDSALDPAAPASAPAAVASPGQAAAAPAATDPAGDSPVQAAAPGGLGEPALIDLDNRLPWMGIDSAGLWAVYGQTCQAAVDVLKERCRQVEDEGHGTAQDDALVDHELPAAAICYAIQASSLPAHRATFSWPFSVESFKPTSRRACLVKAAALLLAEIERLDRAEPAED